MFSWNKGEGGAGAKESKREPPKIHPIRAAEASLSRGRTAQELLHAVGADVEATDGEAEVYNAA